MGERVLKEGYLVKSPDVPKQLHNPKKWQRKWFSLDSSGDLHFSDSEKSSKTSGVLQLWKCSSLFDPKSKGVQHMYCLGLDFGDYSAFLKAESASAFNSWLRLLRDVVKRCELEEVPERHSTLTSSDQHSRSSSVSSVASTTQQRHMSVNTQAKFRKKEGYMAKTGGNNKGWKDRYFVLNQGGLSYYKNKNSALSEGPLGTIDLFECSNVTRTAGKKGHGFDIQMPSRVYNFSTETESDMNEWIEAITHTLEVLESMKAPSLTALAPVLEEGKRHSSGSNVSSSSLDKMLSGGVVEVEVEVGGREQASSEVVGGKEVGGSSQEERDSVVQLLEAEVEALRSKVSSLEADLRSSSGVNRQLQDQLVGERKERDRTIKALRREKEELTAQVEQLERAKEELETFNDSIQAQLEEQQDKTQVLEEEQIALRQELDEAQTNTNAMEEELAETQSRLQEIEEVAHNLEEALRKRGDSEPPPDLSSLRSLNRTYMAKMAEDPSSGPGEEGGALSSGDAGQSEGTPHAQEVLELQQKVATLESALQQQQQQQQHLEDEKPLPSPSVAPPTDTQASELAERLVHEERLKWQVEVVNIRRELDERLEGERRGWAVEREGLQKEVKQLEKDVVGAKSAYQQVGRLQAQLEMSQERIKQLEGEVNTASNKASQLLIEKEKALADLKTIRKTNKSMEKKMSETEEVLRSASRASLSSMGSSADRLSPSLPPPPPSSEDGQKLAEAEKRVSELQAQLSSLEKERDALKLQLEELRSKAAAAPPPAPVATPSFNFFSKTSATVGTSQQAVGGQAQAPPTSSPSAGLRNGWASSSTSSEHPPPKPKKPPKELVDRLSMSSSAGNPQQLKRQPLSFEEGSSDFPPPSIRSRTKSMFQSFFARR